MGLELQGDVGSRRARSPGQGHCQSHLGQPELKPTAPGIEDPFSPPPPICKVDQSFLFLHSCPRGIGVLSCVTGQEPGGGQPHLDSPGGLQGSAVSLVLRGGVRAPGAGGGRPGLGEQGSLFLPIPGTG